MKKNNTLAFPMEEKTFIGNGHQDYEHTYNAGMTLLDYFAAKAMQGILAGADINMEASDLARQSFEVAEAMLAEREKHIR